MCHPAVLAAMSVGSTYMQYQAAKQQASAQTAMYNMNRQNAVASMRDDYAALQRRQLQEQEAAAQQIADRRLEAMRQTSTATVASGESGVSGFSVERVLRDIGAVASRDVQNIEQNRDWSVDQINSELLGVRSNAVSRINSVSPGTKPNPWSYVFQAGADAGATYAAAGGTFGKTKTT